MLKTMDNSYFITPIAQHVWDTKHRHRERGVVSDASMSDTWRRIAQAVAAKEYKRKYWVSRFYDILHNFKFLPGGAYSGGRDYAVAAWRKGRQRDALPPAFITAHELAPTDHLHMQAAIQPYVDQDISKTINIPAD